MKKLLAFALILSVGLWTVGCTPEKKDKAKDKDAKPAAGATDKDKDKTPPATTPAPDKDKAK
jgi:hypothetical protein